MTEPKKFRCSCGLVNTVAMPAAPDEREIIIRAQRSLLAELTRGTKDLARIGKRVLQYEIAIRPDRERGEIRTLAKNLNLSKSTVSEGVTEAEQVLAELQKPNDSTQVQTSALNSK